MKSINLSVYAANKKHVPDSLNNSNLVSCLLWIDGKTLPTWAKELQMTIS